MSGLGFGSTFGAGSGLGSTFGSGFGSGGAGGAGVRPVFGGGVLAFFEGAAVVDATDAVDSGVIVAGGSTTIVGRGATFADALGACAAEGGTFASVPALNLGPTTL